MRPQVASLCVKGEKLVIGTSDSRLMEWHVPPLDGVSTAQMTVLGDYRGHTDSVWSVVMEQDGSVYSGSTVTKACA